MGPRINHRDGTMLGFSKFWMLLLVLIVSSPTLAQDLTSSAGNGARVGP